MTERQKLKKSLSETQNEKNEKHRVQSNLQDRYSIRLLLQTAKPPQEEKIPSETTV